MKNRVIQLISNLFHPLLSMPWAALLLISFTPMKVIPGAFKWVLIGEVFLLSLILPSLIILLLSKLGVVKHGVALRDRKDRLIPIGIQFLLCWLQVICLEHQGLPSWALFGFRGGMAMTLFFFFVTMRWKISGHAAGVASMATCSLVYLFYFPRIVPLWISIALILLAGGVSTIRVYLGRHTLAQVAMGALAGVVFMWGAFCISCL